MLTLPPSAFRLPPFSSSAAPVAGGVLDVGLGHRLAKLLAHLLDAVPQGGRPLEFQRLGGRHHLGLQLGEILFGDVLGLVGPPNGRLATGRGRPLGLDPR